jgi:hypothetical protein
MRPIFRINEHGVEIQVKGPRGCNADLKKRYFQTIYLMVILKNMPTPQMLYKKLFLLANTPIEDQQPLIDYVTKNFIL